MGIRTDRDWRQQLIFFSILLMLAALFTSRVLLSVGIIIFLFFTCFNKNILQQLKLFVTSRFLLGMALLFFIPFVTWFWSDDKQEWMRWARIKLPLFLLPVAFAGQWQLTSNQWRRIAYFFLFLVFAGCCWSLFQYLQNPFEIHSSYLRAKVMATPLENDHVRFSLLVCFAVLCAAFLFFTTSLRNIKILLGIALLFFIVYLHILSARTGLAGLYIILALGLIYVTFLKKKPGWVMALCLAAISMPVIAWFLLPTFQNRIRYMLYDFSFIKEESYLPGANDGSRMLSLRAGWDILTSNPSGVGSGDVVNETNRWYQQHYPQMLETDKLYPSSEWMLYGDAAGWPGIILFTVIMLIPFFEKIPHHRFFWIALNLVAAFSLMFDIGLEAQFGVFIYAFFILGAWKVSGEMSVVSRQSSIVNRQS